MFLQVQLQVHFYPFFVFSQKPKTRINFSASRWSGNKKQFCFLFMANCALLRRYAKFNRLFYKMILLHVIPSSMVKSINLQLHYIKQILPVSFKYSTQIHIRQETGNRFHRSLTYRLCKICKRKKFATICLVI